MKRLTAITVLCVLFLSAFAAGKGPAGVPGYPDSLRSVWLYTEGIKQNAIARDTVRAREFFAEAIRNDSTFAPAYYEMAANGMYSTPDEAVDLARTAFRLDTANKWYHQFLGQALIYARRYDEALAVYRRLRSDEPQNPDNYRILAALYEQAQQPFSAIATLDSAEVRFGRIPVLSTMKRQLLVATRQMDKAVEEAEAMVEAVPYEAEHHVVLADLYGILGKDSLAKAEYDRALQIDSTDVGTLMSLADFYNGRHDYRAVLDVTQRLFESDKMPLDTKIKRFGIFTSDMRFYREYYPQLNTLASTLAVRYPQDRRVVELYAKHLIASGELEQALALYKLHLDDQPPVEEYFRSVIDIESYLQHPDSVNRYIGRAPGALSRAGRFPPLERAYAELFQTIPPGDQSLQTIAGLCPDRFAAQRDLGIYRRHLAPESHRRRTGHRRRFRPGCPKRFVPGGYEAVLQSLRPQPALRSG